MREFKLTETWRKPDKWEQVDVGAVVRSCEDFTAQGKLIKQFERGVVTGGGHGSDLRIRFDAMPDEQFTVRVGVVQYAAQDYSVVCID